MCRALPVGIPGGEPKAPAAIRPRPMAGSGSERPGAERLIAQDGPPGTAVELIYLLARVDVGRLEEVVHRLGEIREVAEVQAVTGPYDVIVKVEAERIPTALDVVVQRIRRIPGVLATETLVAVGR